MSAYRVRQVIVILLCWCVATGVGVYFRQEIGDAISNWLEIGPQFNGANKRLMPTVPKSRS
jgi:hypothetical protein